MIFFPPEYFFGAFKMFSLLAAEMLPVDTDIELNVYFMSLVASFMLSKKQANGKQVQQLHDSTFKRLCIFLLTLTMFLYTAEHLNNTKFCILSIYLG